MFSNFLRGASYDLLNILNEVNFRDFSKSSKRSSETDAEKFAAESGIASHRNFLKTNSDDAMPQRL